jgi:pimeloyl-ACP methyl ester carboxylesterase
LVQVAPGPPLVPFGTVTRTAGQCRAAILIEGLDLRPLQPRRAGRADLRPWQQPGSVFVRTLASNCDVFAFTYGQTAPVQEIADLPALGECVQILRQAGYTEIVLVGFSAGGLVARQFVEDNPGAGVKRVVQICAPNEGSGLANFKAGVGPAQREFLQSLTSQARARALQERQGKKIPADVEFVCVVGTGLILGDGFVSNRSQWPEDLQVQGVPAVILETEHWEALRSERASQLIARLVGQSQLRWDAAQVAAMKRRLWH